MKIAYNILIILAGLGLVLGVIIKIFMHGEIGVAPSWMAPITLWRGALGAAALAMLFVLIDIRDILRSQKP